MHRAGSRITHCPLKVGGGGLAAENGFRDLSSRSMELVADF